MLSVITFAFYALAIETVLLPCNTSGSLEHLYTTVSINGRKCNMLIDTGSGTTTLHDKSRIVNADETKISITTGLSCRLLCNHHVSNMDNINKSIISHNGKPIDGILGMDYLRLVNAVVCIKYKTILQYITVNNASLTNNGYVIYDCNQHEMIIIDASVNDHVSGKFKIDGGSIYSIFKQKFTDKLDLISHGNLAVASTGDRRMNIQTANIKNIVIGNKIYPFSKIYIAPTDMSSSSRFADDPNLDGVIGLDFMIKYDLIILIGIHKTPVIAIRDGINR